MVFEIVVFGDSFAVFQGSNLYETSGYGIVSRNRSLLLIERFNFPRQRSGKRLCIADFFNEISSEKSTDIIPMQAVTMGETASKYSQQLFKENNYTDYLYFHGLAVQMAEALAEWTHSLIRIECGFKDNEPQKVSDILSQKYRGCRYSFGYPACPKVSDSAIQLKLLEAKDVRWLETENCGDYYSETVQGLFNEKESEEDES